MNADLDDFNQSAKDVSRIVDEHLSWFHAVAGGDKGAPSPDGFGAWLAADETKTKITRGDIEKLSSLHDTMMAASRADSLDQFSSAHRDFMKALRESEKTIMFAQMARQADSSVDHVTNLPTLEALERDYKIEMERLTRNGNAFCMALIRVDDFEALEATKKDQALKHLAGLMEKSMRNFDVAYTIAKNEFVMCLKQTDMAGALAAAARLREFLAQDGIQSLIGTGLTISTCLTQPVESEALEAVLENLRRDLEKAADKKDVVVEYQDVSPLQRLATEGKE